MHFRRPSKYWFWSLILLESIFLMLTIFQLSLLISTNHPTLTVKTYFLLGFGLLLINTYLFIGYCYLAWATPYKNSLLDVSHKNPQVLIYKFDRYFIIDKVLQQEGLDYKPYKRLSQKDLREVNLLIEKRGR
ncbi:hypothetical protein [Paenibacillus terrae]|uniref:Uncharacterized protein n=1 Tax=Paenibacillus terrae TaxID=159743 RepID=A0A0D7X1C2_9BACL|nr:hypothetical protein [Paenibacillus terrae]KJD43787.1 hypothetical protein QD47_20830 [Paenibacillus terrae]